MDKLQSFLNGKCDRASKDLSVPWIRFKSLVLCLTAILFIASGCGRDTTTKKVHGVVSYQGKPLTHGKVAFQPVEVFEGQPRRIAVGTIDSHGAYTLSTFEKDDGVVPGEYKVTIISKEQRKSFEGTEEEVATLKSFIPLIYSRIEQTPLKQTVAIDASEPLQIDFALEGELPH